MAGNRDYIPANDADFDNWFYNLSEYVISKVNSTPPAWDHIPMRFVIELANAQAAWREK